MYRTPKEIRDYITEIHKGRSRKEIAEMVNEKFGTDYDVRQIKNLLQKWGLKTGARKGFTPGQGTKLFPKEVMDFIRENAAGTLTPEMARLVNEKFGTSYTQQQMRSFFSNHHVCNGVKCEFVRGHEPFNKGRKGVCAPGCEKTWFVRGQVPKNLKPIGYERITKDGYTEVKIREKDPDNPKQKNFVLKHRLIWEQLHGPIPKGHIVVFRDGNKRNFAPDNLALISMRQNAVLNHSHLRQTDPELFETSAILADLISATNKRRKGQKQD